MPTREPTPDEFVLAAAQAYFEKAGVHWDTVAPSDQAPVLTCMRAAIERYIEVARPAPTKGLWQRAADWWAERHARCTCEIGRTDPHCPHHGLSWP